MRVRLRGLDFVMKGKLLRVSVSFGETQSDGVLMDASGSHWVCGYGYGQC